MAKYQKKNKKEINIEKKLAKKEEKKLKNKNLKAEKKRIEKNRKIIEKAEKKIAKLPKTREELIENVFNTKIIKKTNVSGSENSAVKIPFIIREYGKLGKLSESEIELITNLIENNNLNLIGSDYTGSDLGKILNEKTIDSGSEKISKKINDILKNTLMGVVSKSKILSIDEENKNIEIFQTSPDMLLRKKAKDKLVTSNLRLVVSVAKKHMNKGVDLNDLIQAGYGGLLFSITKFQPSCNTKLGTYATWWIRQRVTQCIMEYGKMIRTPIHITERINQLRILEEKMTNEFGRKPSIEELSLAAGYKPSEVIQYKTITTAPISLDGSLRTDEESSVIDFVKEEGNSSEDFFIADKKKRRIIEIFETIITDSWEWIVLSLRTGTFMDNFVTRLSQISEKGTKFKYTMKSLEKIMEEGDQSYDKIANILKITKDKVKQYENEAKNKIIKYYNNNHKTI